MEKRMGGLLLGSTDQDPELLEYSVATHLALGYDPQPLASTSAR